MEEPSAHQPYTTMIYTTQAKGYVPKCHCGWVGYRKNLSDFTSGYLAQTEALNEAKVHVGTANQEESMPNNADAMTTNPTAATAAIHYHAGHNMPGYMPESDVETYTDIDDAIDGMIETLRYHADNTGSWSDEHDCDDIPCPAYGDDCPWDKARNLECEADSLEADRASVVQAGEFSTYAGDLAYWIEPCADDCDLESEY